MYCLQACSCTFEPGNCTGWGSEGVKPTNRSAVTEAAREPRKCTFMTCSFPSRGEQ